MAGVRYFSVLLSAAIFVTLFLVLRAQKVRWPLLFAMLPLCMGPFLARAIMIRSHVLSISLLLIGMHFMLTRKWKLLGVLGFIYAWSYTFPFLLVMTAVPFIAGVFFVERKFDRKLLAAATAFAGVTLGLVIHPYSPLTFETFLTYIQVTLTGASKSTSAIELGNEIYPMTWRDFFLNIPLYTLVMASIAAIFARAFKSMKAETVGAACAALFWYLLSLHFERFMEYGVPLVVLALGLAVRDLTAAEWKFVETKSLLLGAAAFCGCLPFHLLTLSLAWETVKDKPPARFRNAAAWMEQNLEPGETVAQLFWVEFPELYYSGYRQNYLWGLDPTYTVRDNPETAVLLEKMRVSGNIHPEILAEKFHTRFLILGHAEAMKYGVFALANWEPVYADQYALIFALNGRYGPPPDFGTKIRTEPRKFFPARSIRIKTDE
jgi:hypothetical protein